MNLKVKQDNKTYKLIRCSLQMSFYVAKDFAGALSLNLFAGEANNDISTGFIQAL